MLAWREIIVFVLQFFGGSRPTLEREKDVCSRDFVVLALQSFLSVTTTRNKHVTTMALCRIVEGKPYHCRPQILGEKTVSVLAHSFKLP